ncbi:MAG: T9SS type A sorting domain-containing protein [bacterium]
MQRVTILLAVLCITALAGNTGAVSALVAPGINAHPTADVVNPSNTGVVPVAIETDNDPFPEAWNFPITGFTQALYTVGVCAVGNEMWVTSGGGGTNQAVISVYSLPGRDSITRINQPISTTGWGMRDMAWHQTLDEVYSTGGADNARRLQIVDGTARTLKSQVTIPTPAPTTIRLMALDGNDSLYSSNFNNNPTKFSPVAPHNPRVFNFNQPTDHSMYGAAIDIANGYLWNFNETPTPGPKLVRHDFPSMTNRQEYPVTGATTYGGGCDVWGDYLLVLDQNDPSDIVRCLEVGGTPVANDVGVSAILAPAGNMMPGSIAPRVTIRNFGSAPQSNIPVHMVIDDAGTPVYTANLTHPGPLAPGATADVTFSPNWNATVGSYGVTSWTLLAGDENPGNDTARGTVTVISGGAEDTIHVDGPYSDNAVGLTSGGTFYTAARLTPDMNCNVIAVIFYHHQATQNQFTFVWEQNSATLPGPVVESIPYIGTDTMWVRCDLATPYHLDAGEDVWVGPRYTHAAGQYPGGVDAGPAVAQRGGWINYDGSWIELRSVGLNFNWNIRAIVQYEGGVEEQILEPVGFDLLGAAPMPMRDFSNIRYSLAKDARVNLSIYDVSGTRVRTLIDGLVERGERTASWNRRDDGGRLVSNGTYFYRLTVDGRTQSAKAVVLN